MIATFLIAAGVVTVAAGMYAVTHGVGFQAIAQMNVSNGFDLLAKGLSMVLNR